MKTVSIVCQTTKTLTPENPESPANKGFHEPNNTKMYNSRYWSHRSFPCPQTAALKFSTKISGDDTFLGKPPDSPRKD